MMNRIAFRSITIFLAPFLLFACNLPGVKPTAVMPGMQTGLFHTLPSTLSSTYTPTTIIQIPMKNIQIDGVSYLAYQTPGDPFRFVFPEPCTVDPLLISAQYTGFRIAWEKLIQLTGVDTLPELQPVDIHIKNDKKCGNLGEVGALSFASHNPHGNAFACTYLFEYIKGFDGQPYKPEDAVRLGQQGILIHEYMHTIFFGRIMGQVAAFHDIVTPVAMYIADDWQGEALCDYHPQTPPGDYGGYLIQELYRQNGFRLKDLAHSLIALDNLHQSGGGQLQEDYQHLVPTMSQFRGILNLVLGSDTTHAFAEACWPAELFGDTYTLPSACLFRTPTVHPSPVK